MAERVRDAARHYTVSSQQVADREAEAAKLMEAFREEMKKLEIKKAPTQNGKKAKVRRQRRRKKKEKDGHSVNRDAVGSDEG